MFSQRGLGFLTQRKCDGMNDNYETRNAILSEMGFKTYAAYLRSDLWKAIRTRHMQGKCRLCEFKMANTLHHTSYTAEIMQSGCRNHLVPLCRTCHIVLEFNGFNEKGDLAKANFRLKRALAMPVKKRKMYLKDKKKQMATFKE